MKSASTAVNLWNLIFLKCLIFVGILFVFSGCGASRHIKPVGSGKQQVDLSFGGPIIEVGAPVPAPYSVLGYSSGLNDQINLDIAVHPSAALYKIYVLELGAGYEILKQGQAWPEIFLNSRASISTDFEDFRVFPIFSPLISYQWTESFVPYLGFDFLFQQNENDKVYLPQSSSAFIGFRSSASRHWRLALELKWAGFNHELKYSALDHPNYLGKNGELGTYFLVAYEF